MTDWDSVEKLRKKGASWADIAMDPKVGFTAPRGTDPERALKVLYHRRRDKARRTGRENDRPRGRRGADMSRALQVSGRPVRRWIIGGIALVAIAGLVVYLLILPPVVTNVVTYCGGEGTAGHYHSLIVIEVDGSQQHLPYDPSQSADIGFIDSPGFTNSPLYCPSGGIHALHTHDGSGIIHAELPSSLAGTTPTLGDFFGIWGEPLSSHQVWTFNGSVRATVQNLELGSVADYSSDPGSIPLSAPSCGATCNPAPIPSSLIFNGAYGSGESGGTFSGEIVWLNVTTSPGVAQASAVAGGVACVCVMACPCPASGDRRGEARSGAPVLPGPMEPRTTGIVQTKLAGSGSGSSFDHVLPTNLGLLSSSPLSRASFHGGPVAKSIRSSKDT